MEGIKFLRQIGKVFYGPPRGQSAAMNHPPQASNLFLIRTFFYRLQARSEQFRAEARSRSGGVRWWTKVRLPRISRPGCQPHIGRCQHQGHLVNTVRHPAMMAQVLVTAWYCCMSPSLVLRGSLTLFLVVY